MEPIGRDDELADIVARVGAGRRLVTIVGPGGIGKTTVARAACAALDGSTPESRLVELSRVDRSDAVTRAIAADLGFAEFEVVLGSPDLNDAVIVIDNCEHVAEAAADAVDAMLRACPTLVILATSRAPLALDEESIVALAPLALPPPGVVDSTCGSVQLFRERARDAGVTIDDHHLDLVGEVCRRLDGVPLAIELAAARLRSMSLGEIVTRLGEGIDVLRRPRYRGAVRHRSVRDTIDWSIELLDDEDRAGFARLAVCPGLFDVALVAALVDVAEGEAIELIGRLVDASLVMVDRRSASTRYRLLEPIRAVALDLLDRRGELYAARERLVTHVHDWVGAVSTRASQVWSADLLPDLMARFDQIDVAVRHCLDHDTDPARAQLLYMILWGAVHQARVDDLLELGELVMQRWPDTGPGAATDVVATYAMGKLLCGHPEEAQDLANGALPKAAGSWAAATGLRRVLALAARYRGDHEHAATLLEEAAIAAAKTGAVTFDLECRTYRAQDLAAMGLTDEALDIVEVIAADAARRGSILNEIWARTVQASVLSSATTRDALAQARQVATDALAASEQISYPFGISCNIQTITLCHVASGSITEAAASAERLLDAFARSGLGDFRRALEVAGAVLYAAGHPAVPDLVATARRLPDTNPMVVHLELPPPSDATILDRSAATGVVRAALAMVRAGAVTPSQPSKADRPPADPTFARAGDIWDITFEDTTVHIAATKGMDDLATLLAAPGGEVHCLDLVGGAVEQPATGAVVDTTARRQYEARIRELQADIDEADRHHDIGRADRSRAELDALVDHLTAALGIGGKARTPGATAERARSAVTHRIRSAVDRITDSHPALGRHLRRSLSTGTYCSYRPDPPVRWHVRTSRS